MIPRSRALIAAAVSLALAKHAAADSREDGRSHRAKRSRRCWSPASAPACGKSLEVKRQSQAVVEVITSEDVGKFPDKNVAEALQRVSGVSISREFGEGERVSIRGTAPNLNRTLLNGHAHRDRRLVRARPAVRHAQLQLPDAAHRGDRLDRGHQGLAGRHRRRRHRRHGKHQDAQSARPAVGACSRVADRARTRIWRIPPIRRWARCSAGRTMPRRSASWSPASTRSATCAVTASSSSVTRIA